VKLRAILSAMLFVLAFSFSASGAEQVFFYQTDPAGTPLAMTDSSGAVVWKADYKPFGEENSVTGAAINDQRFVGKEKDEETGLSYFGARYEDARTGRFIAPDPVRVVDSKNSKTNEKLLLNPQGLNAYAYGLNNPYKFVDPDGNEPRWVDVGKSALGIGTNIFGIALGGGLLLAPEPIMSKVTGVAVSVKSWYGVTVNSANLWNAVLDQDSYSTGGLGTDLAIAIAPSNKTAKALGTVSELALDIISGSAGRAVASSLGPLNRYGVERIFVKNPTELGNFATGLQFGDLIKTGIEASHDLK
jgi:RHS repeat-associated core domain